MATGGQIDTDILSDEIYDVLCSICKNKGKNTEGEKFCVDCHDYFCINCVKIHSQVPLCVGHKVLDKAQVKTGTSKGLPRAPAERCDRHSHKHIDMYCQNHDNVGCSTCMAIDHRSCKDIFYIPDFVQNNTYQVASTDIQTKLKSLAKTLAEQVDQFKQDKQRLLTTKSQLLADIRKFRQEINDQLGKLEKSSIDEIEDKVKCLEGKIEDGLKQLQAIKTRFTSASYKLTLPNINTAEVFVYVKMGEDAANAANKCITDGKKIKSTLDAIKFQPDGRILTQLEQNNFLGTLTEKPTLLRIKRKQSHHIKDKYDEDDMFACYTEDGTLIIACADYRSGTLRRYNRDKYTFIDCCDLPGDRPYQVCSINKTQVAVTLPIQNRVVFISLEGQIKITHKLTTNFQCYGLAYTNNHLYISNMNTSVHMFTLSGRKLRQFSMVQSGQHLVSGINCLAVSKDGTRIYVGDLYNGLIVLDNNGQVVSTFNGNQLLKANCCYLTAEGYSVLVSGESPNNVLQFTCDGELIGEIIEADIYKGGILSVCCNQQMSKICITRWGANKFEVYDI